MKFLIFFAFLLQALLIISSIAALIGRHSFASKIEAVDLLDWALLFGFFDEFVYTNIRIKRPQSGSFEARFDIAL